MKLIERYIAGRVLQMALAFVLPVLAIIWLVQVLGRINLVTDSGQSIGSFLLLAALILPTIVPMVLPFGVVIGTAQTLASMNRDSELAIIDGAGTSRWMILKPILVIAAATSILSFSVDNFVEPVVRTKARDMIASVYADLLSSVIEEKTFRKLDDGLYVEISRRMQGRVLKGLFVADYRDPASETIYYAREGAVDANGSTLVMRNGEVQRRDAEGEVSIIRFDSYSFDLAALTNGRGQTGLAAIDRDLPFLLDPDPSDPDVMANPGQYKAELHRRLTEWLFPIIYALVAVAVAGDARSHREARIHPVVGALAISFILRWISYYVSNRIEGSDAFTPILYIVPVAIVVGCIITLREARKMRPRIQSRFSPAEIVAQIRDRFADNSERERS